MRAGRGLALSLLLLASTSVAQAQMAVDTTARVVVAPYLPDAVTTVSVAVGYALLVELSPDERVDNIIVGNSGAWQVAATKRGDQLVIKPVAGDVATDLIVTTTSRRYVFMLTPGGSETSPLVLRFSYPETVSAQVEPHLVAARYVFRGDRSLFPLEMGDDGQRTTITWTDATPLPAVFTVDEKGRAALVNGRMVGSSYVVESVSDRFELVRDKARAIAVRKPLRAKR